MSIAIKKDGFTVEIETPEIYVDNQARKKSGHMSHAMAEFAPGKLINFNSCSSGKRWDGHSPFGYIEYRISEDSGKTYSDVQILPYSLDCLYEGIYVISVEKAVACDDGTIVAFCLRNDATTFTACEPWHEPTVVRSLDGGKTWTEAYVYSQYAGRTYDAVYKDGVIYAMHLCNPNFDGKEPEHVYRLYKSTDNGATFEEASVIDIDYYGKCYGAIQFDAKGDLHAYAYNCKDEQHMGHAVSHDNGKTWEKLSDCYMAKGCRNPQVACLDGVYLLHCRGIAFDDFILYTSLDGYTWDEGTIIVEDKSVPAFYSNNLNLKDEKGNFLLVQYSDRYERMCVNVMHTRIRIVR